MGLMSALTPPTTNGGRERESQQDVDLAVLYTMVRRMEDDVRRLSVQVYVLLLLVFLQGGLFTLSFLVLLYLSLIR